MRQEDMTVRPTFLNQISLGNWLTIAMMLIAGVATWDKVQDLGEENRATIAVAKDALGSIEARVASLESRARTLETEQARVAERFNSIMQLLNRIDARTERLEREDG